MATADEKLYLSEVDSWFLWMGEIIIEVKFNFLNLCVRSLLGSSSSYSSREIITLRAQFKVSRLVELLLMHKTQQEARAKEQPTTNWMTVDLKYKSVTSSTSSHSKQRRMDEGPTVGTPYYVTRLMNGWTTGEAASKPCLLHCPSVIHLNSCPPFSSSVRGSSVGLYTLWSGFVQNELNEKCRLFSSSSSPSSFA